MTELLFSLGPKDFRVDTYRGSGKGGQKRNKTESAVRVTHIASSATGSSDDTRDQRRNRSIAFERMVSSKQFKDWHKLEVAKRTGALAAAEEYAERELRNARVEYQKDGVWVEE